MFRYILLSAWCLLLRISGTSAQDQNIEFGHFPSHQRLSLTTVSWITQDDKGFLWLATEDGLFKYDGYTFSHYQANTSLKGSPPHNLLLTVYKDQSGRIWAGSSNGICRYSPPGDDFEQYRPDPGDVFGTKGNFIQRIAGDKTGMLWIATYDGLYAFNPLTHSFTHYPANPLSPNGLSHAHVRSLLIDRKNRLWAGTEKGLDQMDLFTKRITRYLANTADPYNLSNEVIRCLYEDRRGNIWVGTQKGLHQLDPATGHFTHYRHRPGDSFSLSSDTVLALLEDSYGQLWAGTWNGLNRLDAGRDKFTSYFHEPGNPASISGNTVTALFADRAGTLWIGTDKGINQAVLNRKKFHHYFYSWKNYKNDNNVVTALCEDGNDQYWIGIRNYVVRFDKRRNTGRYFDCRRGNQDLEIHSITRDAEGRLWIGSGEGFFTLDSTGKKLKDYSHLISHPVWDIYIDQQGFRWIGTAQGLYAFNPETHTLRRFRTRNGDPFRLTAHAVGTTKEDRTGGLWIGTLNGGLLKFDKRTGKITRYTHRSEDSTSISSNQVTVIHEGKQGLWVGTGKGLNWLDTRSGVFTHFPDPDHQIDEIYGMLEDDHGNLWINYREGIGKFAVGSRTWSYYQLSDGLQYEYNPGDNLKNAKGEMVLSGLDGLTIFHPDSIKDNRFIPPVVITRFSVFNKPVFPDGTLLKKSISETPALSLSYRQATFSFEFAALNFIHPEENRYAYKLEGYEKDWNYAGTRRFASYSNVPGGKTYVFRVKASNDDEVWNEQSAAIRIYITPPFWQTVWFKGLAAATVAGLGLAFHQIRVRQYQRHRRELERQVVERTAEISWQKDQLERQAWEIDRMNQLLQKDNQKLEENVKDLAEARVLQKEVTFAEFQQIYPTDEACLQFLAHLKWNKGYACSKCGHTSYAPGPVSYSRRCSRSSTIERATTGTIFCRTKFPITKGFYMLFLLSQEKNLTVDELSKIVSHPRQTCWVFRKKVLEVINSKTAVKRNKDGWSHLVLGG